MGPVLSAKLKSFKFSSLNLSGFFLKIFLVIFPFQIQSLIFKSDSFSGQFNMFSSVFLNLSEVTLWAALFFFACHLIGGAKPKMKLLNVQNFAILFYLMAAILSVFWAADKMLSLLMVFKIVELIVLYFLLAEGVLSKKEIFRFLIAGGLIQLTIGILQYIKQGSLGLTFLGEPNLDISTLNVAKINLGGEKLIRAYGTFPHANVFGGYLVFLLSLICVDLRKDNFQKYLPIIIAFLIGLLISFSRTAWLASLTFLVILFSQHSVKINWKYFGLGILLLFSVLVIFNLHTVILSRITDFSGDAYTERAIFTDIGRAALFSNPMGIGLGNFVIRMGEFSNMILAPWLFQQIHNVFLLTLVEQGIIGGIALLGVFIASVRLCFNAMRRLLKMEKYQWKVWMAAVIAFLILGLFDHYLYTIWSGQVMFFLLLGMINYSWQERKAMDLDK